MITSSRPRSYETTSSLPLRRRLHFCSTFVQVLQATTASPMKTPCFSLVFITSLDNRYHIYFPPSVKLEDGAQHKNLRIFSVSTGKELISFTEKSQQGWDLQYTISESRAVHLVSQEIQVFRATEWSKGVFDKRRVEGASMVSLSPGLNPSIAIFVAEKKVWFTITAGYTCLTHH